LPIAISLPIWAPLIPASSPTTATRPAVTTKYLFNLP
jgi:hypothetical protein